jgi:hypothetical protein
MISIDKTFVAPIRDFTAESAEKKLFQLDKYTLRHGEWLQEKGADALIVLGGWG